MRNQAHILTELGETKWCRPNEENHRLSSSADEKQFRNVIVYDIDLCKQTP
jgi:hypothetical protein